MYRLLHIFIPPCADRFKPPIIQEGLGMRTIAEGNILCSKAGHLLPFLVASLSPSLLQTNLIKDRYSYPSLPKCLLLFSTHQNRTPAVQMQILRIGCCHRASAVGDDDLLEIPDRREK